jgi:transcriptional regulator with XRE-family HTH domain
MGVSLGAVQFWLKGRVPSSKNLERIAAAANMSIEGLFNEIRGEDAKVSSKKAEDILLLALQLDEQQQKRLIKLLVNRVL